MQTFKITILFLIINATSLFAGINDTVKKKEKAYFIATAIESGLYVSSIGGLNYLWYSKNPQTSFHLFNDANEWLQVDKCGHTFSSFWLSRASYELLKPYTSKKKALFTGTALAYSYMLGIEVLDGFSEAWGASVTDLAANTLGASVFFLQEYYLENQPLLLKFSYLPTSFAQYRPDVLGSNNIERLLKDYNGQTYWLSVNVKNVLKSVSVPPWLNLAVGYGATGMTGGKENVMGVEYAIRNTERQRQFYLSLDADLSRIKTRSILLKKILGVVNVVKIPFPALCYSNRTFSMAFF